MTSKMICTKAELKRCYELGCPHFETHDYVPDCDEQCPNDIDDEMTTCIEIEAEVE